MAEILGVTSAMSFKILVIAVAQAKDISASMCMDWRKIVLIRMRSERFGIGLCADSAISRQKQHRDEVLYFHKCFSSGPSAFYPMRPWFTISSGFLGRYRGCELCKMKTPFRAVFMQAHRS